MKIQSLGLLVGGVVAQQAGKLTEEKHPGLTTSVCTKSAGCKTQQQAVTIDANWRWTHKVGEATNCYEGDSWDESLCPDPVTCAKNCVLEGADKEYTGTYGVNAEGSDLRLNFVTKGQYSTNIGSRVFLMADESSYQMFQLKNKEFTIDVDDSTLPCGLNGALYFVEMDADGGMAKYPGNSAGAKFGTGYCDAQCPRDVKYINGEANSKGWTPSASDKNSGVGDYGSCCTEMDIWEANTISTAYTPHACSTDGPQRCTGIDCGGGDDRYNGLCDKNGCDLQTYRLGNSTFWGPGSQFAVDSTKKVTVTTQFITDDGTDTGNLKEIRRIYKQDGQIINVPPLMVGNEGPYESVTTEFCESTAKYFDDGTNFLAKGGLRQMDKSMSKGMVLVMSLWDDHEVNMLWLDSTFPANGTANGSKRGTCPTSSGKPDDVESNAADAHVIFSNIKWGEIGTTL